MALDEHALAVEHVDVRIGHLAVQRQHHAVAFHRGQRRIGIRERSDAGIRVRRRTRRVILDRVDDARRAFARAISAADVRSVRYSVISGSNDVPGGQRREDSRRDRPRPPAVVVTGGFRLGMTIARPNTRAVAPTTAAQRGAVAQVAHASRRGGSV